MEDEELRGERVRALLADLRGIGDVVVAFSGGADSALLLAAAVRALGAPRVTAATAVSPSLPSSELAAAAEFVRDLGVEHLTPGTDEMSREGYRANGGDRCYFCKAELLDVLTPLARARAATVLTGTNADDAVAGFRPGIRAATERGARTPLRDAGLTKRQIRDVSREWGLPTWDKPAAACLSSRIAYGLGITPERLARVERAEAGLRTALGGAGHEVGDLRVRDLGQDTARIEVGPELLDVLRGDATLRAAAGDWVGGVHVRAFRSGSMNDALRGSRLVYPVGSAPGSD